MTRVIQIQVAESNGLGIQFLRNSMKKQTATRDLRRGFSLTELLIVMAILVLLVSLVGPRLLGTKKKADVSSVKTQIGMLQSSLEQYAIDMNKFPSTEEGLKALLEDPTGSGGESSDDLAGEDGEEDGGSNWAGPYLKSTTLPKDPWGKAYKYEYPPTHGKGDTPDIWSLGPDGEENTDDDVVSWKGGSKSDGGSGDVLDDPVE